MGGVVLVDVLWFTEELPEVVVEVDLLGSPCFPLTAWTIIPITILYFVEGLLYSRGLVI